MVDRYVAAAVDGEYRSVATMAPNTGRNVRLFQAAANLGEFVGAGVLSQGEVEDALQQAATECGLVREDGLHAVRMTIASGIRKGFQNPRKVA
jgi:putative DNA primase/helicase